MKKRVFALALAGLMAFSLAACGGQKKEEAASSSSAEAKVEEAVVEAVVEEAVEEAVVEAVVEEAVAEAAGSITVGLAFPLLDEGMTALSEGMIHFLEENEAGIEVECTLTNADSDINKLINDVESLIAMSPDCIYIMNSIGDQGVIPAVKACNDAGIPVGVGVSIDGYNDYTFLYEGFSQYACGQMQAEYMDTIYDEKAEYNCAIITGDAGNTAGFARSNGFIENFIDKHDNAKMVIQGEGNWNTADAQALADDWLVSHPEINVFACANDDEAQGVVNACKAANRDDVIIVSVDATDLGKSLIEDGTLACSVAINFGGVAKCAADTIISCALGEITGKGNEVLLTTENLEIVTADTL